MIARPDWDTYFLQIASTVSSRGTCDRAQVGTVLVRDKRILTTGFNGSPSGMAHCSEIGHLMWNGHCVRTVHSEANAIIQAARHGVSTDDADCYVTHFPCFACTKLLINAGVKRVVYINQYRVDDDAVQFFTLAGVDLTQRSLEVV